MTAPEDIVEVAVKNKMTTNQVLFMYYLQNKMNFPIELTQMESGELKVRGYLVRGAPTETWLKATGKNIIRPISFTFDSDLLPLINHITGILIQHEPGKATMEKLEDFFINNELLSKLFYTWLCMFPSDGEQQNKGWKDLFNVPYSGVAIRKLVPKYANNFKKLARRKDFDVGIFIIGTFLYIRSNIHNGRPFIPRMDKFLELQDEWYAQAEDFLSSNGIDGIYELVDQDTEASIFNYQISAIYQALVKTLLPSVTPSYYLPALNTHLKKNLHEPFLVWMGLFPSENKEENKNWESFFGVEYAGTNIRKVTADTINAFKSKLRSGIDTGVFLIGTYMFVKSQIKDGKTFIPSIEKFLDVSQEWYIKAFEATDQKSVADIYNLFNRETSVKQTVRTEGSIMI
jgi:hypothetical protein